MNVKLIKLVALITGLVFLFTSVGYIGYSIIFGN